MKFFQILGLTATIIGASTSVAHAGNLVTNGGFETGNFAGWTQSGNTGFTSVSSSDPRSGSYSALLGPIDSLGFLSQTLATSVGKTYELSYFLKSDGLVPNEFETLVSGITLFDQKNIPTQPYTEYKFDFVATGASTDLKFGFQNNPGFLRLDDVSVNAVPEPDEVFGVLSVLGLGLLLKKKASSSKKQQLN